LIDTQLKFPETKLNIHYHVQKKPLLTSTLNHFTQIKPPKIRTYEEDDSDSDNDNGKDSS